MKHLSSGLLLKPLVVALLFSLPAVARDTVTFPSEGGVTVTVDVYMAHESRETPFLVLCHQARWSRGEFLRIGPWLNELGYNCMAVDLRAGKTILGIPNETAQRARENGLNTDYSYAEPDIVAAVKYAREHYAKGKLILVGSSFSASLVLRIAGETSELVDGVAAFSPGEYFANEGKCADWTQQSAAKIKTCPVFIAWSEREHVKWHRIARAIPCEDLTVFAPTEGGQHGARVLWEESEDSELYRTAFKAFLSRHFPRPSTDSGDGA